MLSLTDANRMRWRFTTGHYEAWYAVLAHRASRTGFWIRYTLRAPTEEHGPPVAELWFSRFDPARPDHTFGFHRTFGIGDLRHEPEPFRLRIGDAELRPDGMKGHLAAAATPGAGGHEVEWSLDWEPAENLHLHLPTPSYFGGYAPTEVLSPNLNVAARGHLIVDGDRYEVEGDPLSQSHLWGRKHAYSWAWAHAGALAKEGGDTVLEALTVRLRRGPIVLPKVTMFTLLADGERVEFREPWELPFARSDYATGRYKLEAAGLKWKVEAELSCRPEDMIRAEYIDPDGDPAYCHHTGCADARITVSRRTLAGFREWKRLQSERCAHFEWGARAGDPLVHKKLA